VSAGGPYHVTAYKPNDPSKVRVLVSLSKENVYVMEGDRSLMAAAISVAWPRNLRPEAISTFIRNRSISVLDRTDSACKAIK